jgi:hypothetical protein
MHPIFQKRSRVFALVSLMLLAQCCCCILPIGWRVEQTSPAVQQVLNLFQAGLMAIR